MLTTTIPHPGTASPSRSSRGARPVENIRVRPSVIPAELDAGFTLDQEFTHFARWTSDPIWVPPKNFAGPMANTILDRFSPWSDKQRMWRRAENEHRSRFTQVREIELRKPSIRLPRGRVYASVLSSDQFDQIEETVPNCVQTRLREFMDGPAKRLNAKVYYLKPLCVEVGSDLIFTTGEELQSAIDEVRDEVFQELRRRYLRRIPRRVTAAIVNGATAMPRTLVRNHVHRRRRKIADYQAKLEFERRKTARAAMLLHRKCRTDGCTYDEMLGLTNPLETEDVVNQFALEHELSQRGKREMLRIAAGTLPWFFAASLATVKAVSVTTSLVAVWTAPVALCDPAFVAEIPNSNGSLIKIGHFDEIDGVTHIEL